MKKELVIIAPMQIKTNIGLGNIYDLTVADFYVKSRRMAGYSVSFPFLWNVNGEPIVKLAKENNIEITSQNLSNFATKLIQNYEPKFKEHYLDFDYSIRDDQISNELMSLASGNYLETLRPGISNVNICSSCGNMYGSDPSISICKSCGGKTKVIEKQTIFKHIKRDELNKKISNIQFYPESIKSKLADFMNHLPDEYDLILEKKRQYTTSIHGYELDPKFVTIMLSVIANNANYDMITFIHGDVIKKFDYYAFCYLNDADMPTRVVSHQLVLNPDKQKLRWRNDNGIYKKTFSMVGNKELRAFLLKNAITRNIIIDPLKIKENTKGLIRIYLTMGKLLENRNLDISKYEVRPELEGFIKNFHLSVDKLKLPSAFDNMKNYVDKCWKIVREDKLSEKEFEAISHFRQLYFGDKNDRIQNQGK
jgi:hypothetical protein